MHPLPSLSPSLLTPPFPKKAYRRWVPSHPNLSASNSSLPSTPPESHVSRKNFLTRSLTTSQTIPPLFVVVRWPRGPSYHRAAVTFSGGSSSGPTIFLPGSAPSPIRRLAPPHIPARSASISHLIRRHSLLITCNTSPMSVI